MTSTAASPESQKKQRKPPLSSFPTVKIFTPPSGLHSRKIDEWCLTLCTQSTFNRHQGRLPECHSVCLRRVFPLEVRRLMALHQSRNPGAGAGALPPLPPEGQPERVPWQLGGKRGKVESDAMDGDYDEDDPPTGIPGRVLEPPRTWKEGWYLWSMGSLSAFWNHTHQMATTLENVDQNGKVKRPPRRQPARLVEIDHEFDNHTEENLLIPIPPDTPPIIEPVKKFLKPSGLVLNIFYDSVVEGHQREFFGRVWEKAQTDEPWKLAYNSVKRFYERWKQNARSGDDDEEEKRR